MSVNNSVTVPVGSVVIASNYGPPQAVAASGPVPYVGVCPTQEIRDMIIDSGMEGGMHEAMDRLEQVAISLG
jgi:hypothetical protein